MERLTTIAINDKLLRVEHDIAAGRLKRAIDRLHGHIYANPNELIFRQKLGELYHQIRFLENAGCYWYLFEPKTDEIAAARAIFEESVNRDPLKILTCLKFRGDIDQLESAFAKELIRSLQQKSLQQYNWFPDYRAKITAPIGKLSIWMNALMIGVVLLIILFLIIGFITTVKWIFS